jgi:hypothetical protein
MSDANFWQLRYVLTDTTQSFADWGITGAVRQIFSMATDKFTFAVASAAFDATAPFAIDETAEIYRNGTRVFYGRVTKITRSAVPGAEAIVYELSGPWWYFENLPFEQSWNLATNPAIPGSGVSPSARSRIILFQTIAGARQTLIEAADEIIDYVVAAGGPLIEGTLDLGSMKPPFSEIRDITCAEAIRAVCRWRPDAIGYFDYSASPVAFNLRLRGDLTVESLPVVDAPAAGVSITPRNDLLLNGVVIRYESVNSINEVSWTTVSTDSAGTPGFKTARFTIELGGSSTTTQIQSVTINSVNVTARAFWESMHPWLHQATSVTIGDVRVNGTLVTGQSSDSTDGSSGYSGMGLDDFSGAALAAPFTSSNFQAIITAGQVPYWISANVANATITAKISYTLQNADTGAEEIKVKVPFALKCKITDLNTSTSPQTFEQRTAFTAAESTPTGVATAFFDACSALHYDGQFSRIDEECPMSFGVGNQLNLTGGPAEWETMNALIQTVTERIDTGETVYRFGPPAHLMPGDFVDLQRTQRQRTPSWRLQERVDGKYLGAGAQVAGAIQVVQSNASPSQIPGEKHTVSKKTATVTGQVEGAAAVAGSVTHTTQQTDTSGDLRATVAAGADTAGDATHSAQKTDSDGATLISRVNAAAADDSAAHHTSFAVEGDVVADVESFGSADNAAESITYTDPDANLFEIVIDTADIASTGALAGLGTPVRMQIREIDVCMTDPEDETAVIPGKMLVVCSLPYPA